MAYVCIVRPSQSRVISWLIPTHPTVYIVMMHRAGASHLEQVQVQVADARRAGMLSNQPERRS